MISACRAPVIVVTVGAGGTRDMTCRGATTNWVQYIESGTAVYIYIYILYYVLKWKCCSFCVDKSCCPTRTG